MSSKNELLAVLEEDDDQNIDRLYTLEKDNQNDYDPRITGLLPTSLSSSDIDESDLSDNYNDADLLGDCEEEIDPDKTLQKAKELNNFMAKHEQDSTNQQKESSTAFRNRPSSCVFVASLAASFTDDELSQSVTKHFKQWGDLALVKVLRDPSNRPYAFVQYKTDEDAKKALKYGQHSTLNGRSIRCERAKVNRTLYIATASGSDISLKDIKETLSSYGEIEQMIGNNDSIYRKSNLNKAWFCQFAYRDDAIRAYANLRSSFNWVVEWAQNIESPNESAQSKEEPDVIIDNYSIFVGQLDAKATKGKLLERFSNHGKIVDCTLVVRPGNTFAFIKYETEKAAASAVERENHAVFMDKTMHVQYRELHRRKSSNFGSLAPRLNLAPPPVNLPSRRASTGSVFNPGSNVNGSTVPLRGQFPPVPNVVSPFSNVGNNGVGVSSHNLNRSVSFSTERPQNLRYRNNAQQFIPASLVQYSLGAKSNDVENTPPKEKKTSNAYQSPHNKQITPASSPSNTINSSQGESKSLYSSSTVSALEPHLHDDSTNPTTSGYGQQKHTIYQHRRGIIQPALNTNVVPQSPYYYYAPPLGKDNFVYDKASYVPYASYPYYYPDPSGASLMDYPQPPPGAPVNSAGHMTPAPYYMYYSVHPPSFNENAQAFENSDSEVQNIVSEIDY